MSHVQPGSWQSGQHATWPQGHTSGQAPEQPLVVIGDITVSASWVVTPAGNHLVKDVSWTVTDLSRSYRATPSWAIVAAVIGFFFFLLGLFLLLVKEDRTDGWIQVTVSAPGFTHTTSIAARSMGQVADVHNRVNYARSVTAAAQASRR